MKKCIALVILLLSAQLFAATVVGNVTSLSGSVKVKHQGSISKIRLKKGDDILTGDLVSSSKGGVLNITLVDNSQLVLDELSSIHFSSVYSAEQNSGKVLYKITSRDAKHSLKIKTPFAIIGIKGTTFIVNATQTQSVMLKEGLIGVSSIKEEFKLYRKKLEDEFNSFKAKNDAAMQQERDDFEKYKSMQNGSLYEKPEITKEFDLSAGNSISFDGQEVKEKAFSKDEKNAFKYFDTLIEKMR